jgi:hypothetical protein
MKLKSIFPHNVAADPGKGYLLLIYILLACLGAFFPASLLDSFPDCGAVPSYSGVFGAIHQRHVTRYTYQPAYISFIADDKSEYRLLLMKDSPLYSAVGRGRVSLINYHDGLLDYLHTSYFYPVKAELDAGSKPLLTCEDYRAIKAERSSSIWSRGKLSVLLLIGIGYLWVKYSSMGDEKSKSGELFGNAEYVLLILISLAVIISQFPTTILDTFPRCEQSSRLSGTLSPASHAAAGKLELLTDGGQRVALYRPETLGALPAANRWQVWVTSYHPDSLRESTYYPVRIKADEQQLLGCEEYHHFVSSVLDQQQQQLYLMLAAMLVGLFSLWRIIARVNPTQPA